MEIVEFIQANPKIGVILFAIAVTTLMTLIRYVITDKAVMREIKEKQRIIREEMKLHKDNPEKMMDLNKEMMSHLPAQMKQSFKVLLITFVPILIIFKWARGIFAATTLASSWIWWYIIASMIFGIALAKILNLD